MNDPTKIKEVPPAIAAARSRYSEALRRQGELANSSIANPALEADYQRAVADVAAAEANLQEVSR